MTLQVCNDASLWGLYCAFELQESNLNPAPALIYPSSLLSASCLVSIFCRHLDPAHLFPQQRFHSFVQLGDSLSPPPDVIQLFGATKLSKMQPRLRPFLLPADLRRRENAEKREEFNKGALTRAGSDLLRSFRELRWCSPFPFFSLLHNCR